MENEINIIQIIEEIKERVSNFNKKEAISRLQELYELTRYHANLYYNNDEPEISDFEYDMLIQEIREIEEKFPNLKKEESLSSNVGGKASEKFFKVEHTVPMQSLLDVFTFGEVEDFVTKIKEKYNSAFVVETKIDGLSASLTYENGKLVQGLTRGDGLIGEDVTENILEIKNVPKHIEYKGKLVLRGEVYISKKDFEKVVSEQIESGKKVFANARNAAAGSLRQKESEEVKKRKLSIFIFNIQESDKIFKSHIESLEFVQSLGFTINPFIKKANSYKEVKKLIEEIGEKREEFSFGIDGAVVKVDDINIRKKLGSTSKAPRWAIAFKYPPIQKVTQVKKIEITIGRTGALTPLAHLDKVSVDGSAISKVTLHNFEYLEEKDVRIGDYVIIQKAGDIIPEIVEIIKSKRTGEEVILEVPKTCPKCGKEVIKKGADIYCKNPECPEKKIKEIEYFVSRNCMNIQGFAEKNILSLMKEQKLKDISDIYYLKKEDFLKLKKSGEKYANNMMDAINKSKDNDLYRLIAGFGIENVGISLSKNISNTFKSLDNFINATDEKLLSIDDLGIVALNCIRDYFNNPKNMEIIQRLKKAGVNTLKKDITKSNILENKIFVVTGSFDIHREEIEKEIEINGGRVTKSVSKNTDFLIVGKKAGSKKEKADKLGIKQISLEEFKKMI